jgi:hypothetical protein
MLCGLLSCLTPCNIVRVDETAHSDSVDDLALCDRDVVSSSPVRTGFKLKFLICVVIVPSLSAVIMIENDDSFGFDIEKENIMSQQMWHRKTSPF